MTASRAEVDAILAFFDLPKCIEYARLGGWANQNLLVTLPAGQSCVLKILEWQRTDLLANDFAIQAQLHAAGIVAPQYLANHSGATLYSERGINAVVSRRLPGIHCSDLGPEFCYEIGYALAAFHGAVKRLPKPHASWLNTETTQHAIRLPAEAPVARQAQNLIAENLPLFAMNLPVGIIHGDFHENNVLVESEHNPRVIAVMDFEEAEENLLILDVARTILSSTRDDEGSSLDPHRITSLLRGYQTTRTLTEAEVRALPSAIRYVIGAEALWLHAHEMDDEAAIHMKRAHLPEITLP